MTTRLKKSSVPGQASSRALPKQPKGTGSTYVYDQMRADILELRLMPGTHLDESEMSRRLGVSRSPVREAIIRLAAEGLVETLRNRSAVVASVDMLELPAYFDSLTIIYRLTTRAAAHRADTTAVNQLDGIQDALEQALADGNPHAMMDLNRAFHQTIAECAGNRWFMQWQRSLLDQGQRYFRLYARHYGDHVPPSHVEYHRTIIRALREGDAEAADAAGAADAEIIRVQLLRFISGQTTGALRLTPLGAGRPAADGVAKE